MFYINLAEYSSTYPTKINVLCVNLAGYECRTDNAQVKRFYRNLEKILYGKISHLCNIVLITTLLVSYLNSKRNEKVNIIGHAIWPLVGRFCTK